MKEIEAKVARKQQLAKHLSREKTVATWVAEFFTEHEKTKRLEGEYQYLTPLALNRLAIQLRTLDRKCDVYFRQSEEETNPVVEVRWSAKFIQANNCEEVLVFDASAAFFQSAIEDIT